MDSLWQPGRSGNRGGASAAELAIPAGPDHTLTVPEELLALVFRHVDFRTQAMVITRVCRRWEQVCGGNLTVDFDFGWRVFGSVQRERLSNRILVTVARRFHGIRVLRLSGCQRPTPSGMMEALRASRAGLVTLDLSGCAWTVATNLEPTLARFGASLQTLVLVGCPGLDNAGMVQIGRHCPDLRRLDISSRNQNWDHPPRAPRSIFSVSRVTDVGLTAVAEGCKRLEGLLMRHLYGEQAAVTDAGIVLVAAACPNLSLLDLSGCKQRVTSVALRAIGQHCPRLSSLSVEDCAIDPGGLSAIAGGCPELTYLRFGVKLVAGYVTDKSLAHLVAGCPRLDINEIGSEMCGDLFLAAVAAHRPETVQLNLNGCDGVTANGLLQLAGRCPQLTAIKLRRIDTLSDPDLAALIRTGPLLHPNNIESDAKGDEFLAAVVDIRGECDSLDLFGCTGVTDAGLKLLAGHGPLPAGLHQPSPDWTGKHMRFLRSIDLQLCHNVTDIGLAALIAGCRMLEPDLVMSGVKGVQFLTAIGRSRPDCRSLRFEPPCPGVTDAGLAKVIRGCVIEPDDVVSIVKGNLFVEAIGATRPGLEQLSLKKCTHVTDQALRVIQSTCTKIRSLSLEGCSGVTGLGIIAMLGRLPRLVHIDLRGMSSVRDTVVSAVGTNCPDLEVLNLRDCAYVSHVGLTSLSACSRLTELDIRGVPNATDGCLAFLVRMSPALRPDSVKSNKKGDQFLAAAAEMNPGLQSIYLFECVDVTTEGLRGFLNGVGETVEGLDLRDCTQADHGWAEIITDKCKRLTTIDVLRCANVTDAGLASLVRGCQDLLPDCIISHNKGNAFLRAVADVYPTISSLDLYECKGVTDDGLKAFVEACPELKRLNLDGCIGVTLETRRSMNKLLKLAIAFAFAE